MSINGKSSIPDLQLQGPFNGFPFNHILPSLLDPLTSISFQPDTSGFGIGRIDWKETPEAHVFKVDLPGIKKEDVKVEVEERNVLQISGERIGEDEDKNDTWHLVERSSGKFLRRFRLPEHANMDQIKAAMENGILTVTVPKKEEVKKKMSEVKSIEIESGKGGGSGCLSISQHPAISTNWAPTEHRLHLSSHDWNRSTRTSSTRTSIIFQLRHHLIKVWQHLHYLQSHLLTPHAGPVPQNSF